MSLTVYTVRSQSDDIEFDETVLRDAPLFTTQKLARFEMLAVADMLKQHNYKITDIQKNSITLTRTGYVSWVEQTKLSVHPIEVRGEAK